MLGAQKRAIDARNEARDEKTVTTSGHSGEIITA